MKNHFIKYLSKQTPQKVSCNNCQVYLEFKDYDHCGECSNYSPDISKIVHRGNSSTLALSANDLFSCGKTRRTSSDLLKMIKNKEINFQ